MEQGKPEVPGAEGAKVDVPEGMPADDPTAKNPAFSPGSTVADKYVVERLVGEGGLGVVVAAKHLQLDQTVAIKYLRPRALGNRGIGERFLREARLSARMRSEHAVHVYDVGTVDGTPYMVMELLVGTDLGRQLQTSGTLTPERAIDYVLQACEALAEAHMAGIVHRDIKPDNLFIATTGGGKQVLKILDFGISKMSAKRASIVDARELTEAGDKFGTPVYMSPEQLMASAEIDARADVWAMGVVFFELLTGQMPFDGDSLPELCTAILNKPPAPLLQHRVGLPPELAAVILRCLEKDPANRFQNVAELAQEPRALRPAGRAGPHRPHREDRRGRRRGRPGFDGARRTADDEQRARTARRLDVDGGGRANHRRRRRDLERAQLDPHRGHGRAGSPDARTRAGRVGRPRGGRRRRVAHVARVGWYDGQLRGRPRCTVGRRPAGGPGPAVRAGGAHPRPCGRRAHAGAGSLGGRRRECGRRPCRHAVGRGRAQGIGPRAPSKGQGARLTQRRYARRPECGYKPIRMKLRALAVLLPSLVVLAPHPARADGALDEARTLFNKATVEYNVGRFQQALELYTKAYERMPKPALLFNIGQCHRLLGHYDQALFFYSGYLREQPDAPNRGLVEQHIAEAKQALEQQRAAQTEAQRSAAQQSASSPPPAPAHASEQGQSSAPPPPPVASAPDHSSPVLRIAGLATAGAGVVLLGTGVALGVHANSVSNELSQVSSQHGTWTTGYQSDYDSGKSAATAATVLYVVGAAAIVGGVEWLHLARLAEVAPGERGDRTAARRRFGLGRRRVLGVT